MRWVAISGSWRYDFPGPRRDVAREVGRIFKSRQGLVAGGAFGVDYFAVQSLLKLDKKANNLTIILPTDLSIYVKHYEKRAKEGVITSNQAKNLAKQLKFVQKANKNAIIEGPPNLIVNEEAYYKRNKAIVDHCNELAAF